MKRFLLWCLVSLIYVTGAMVPTVGANPIRARLRQRAKVKQVQKVQVKQVKQVQVQQVKQVEKVQVQQVKQVQQVQVQKVVAAPVLVQPAYSAYPYQVQAPQAFKAYSATSYYSAPAMSYCPPAAMQAMPYATGDNLSLEFRSMQAEISRLRQENELQRLRQEAEQLRAPRLPSVGPPR